MSTEVKLEKAYKDVVEALCIFSSSTASRKNMGLEMIIPTIC